MLPCTAREVWPGNGVGKLWMMSVGRGFCLASLCLLALFVAAGMAALPLRGASPNLSFVPVSPDTLPPLNGVFPVLTLRPDRSTIRSGYAKSRPRWPDPRDPV